MAWTTPRTWVAGETVTAAIMNTHVRDNLKAIGDPWLTYTPALTAATVNPTIGTTAQVQAGSYLVAGKLVIGRIKIKFGTTGPAAGTGQYFVAMPPVAAVVGAGTSPVAGNAYLFDASTSASANPVPYIATSTTFGFLYPAAWPTGALSFVGAALPWAWAGADELNLNFAYEAA